MNPEIIDSTYYLYKTTISNGITVNMRACYFVSDEEVLVTMHTKTSFDWMPTWAMTLPRQDAVKDWRERVAVGWTKEEQ